MELVLLAFCSAALIFAMVTVVSRMIIRDKLRLKQRVISLSKEKETKLEFDKKKSKKSFFTNASWLFEGKALMKISSDLSLAAIPLRAEEFLMIWILATLVPSSLIALFSFNIFVYFALIVIGASLPPVLLRSAKKKRMTLFDKQLGDALAIMGNCLRGGFSFNQALDSIAREMPDPLSKEFAKTIRDIKLGLSMEKALANMVERMDNGDLELIVSAVLIQRQVGGNLSEILDSIADTIKERLRLKGEIKVLTATGKTSGLVVGLLPVFLMLILMLINPSYVGLFFNTKMGMALLLLAFVLEMIGFVVVKKIVDIKF